MFNQHSAQPLQAETTCGSLLSELQRIWDEIGETKTEKNAMLLELERECLEAYKRKVDQASRSRAQLHQEVANSEAELAHICTALGERPSYTRQSSRSLKKEIQAVKPLLEEMRKKRMERKSQFVEVMDQIHRVSKELYGSTEVTPHVAFDESDLSLQRLEDLQKELHSLQNEKRNRLKQIFGHLNTLNLLCLVLGMDFKLTISQVHPTLVDTSGSKDTSTDTIERLAAAIHRLKLDKKQRLRRVQDLATSMVELWNLMDTPVEEQQLFENVIQKIATSEEEITAAGALSTDFINSAEAEVSRLQKLKSSKMKEVLLKKKLDLEEICRKGHMVMNPPNSTDFSVESGAIDPLFLLEKVEGEISRAKEDAFNRKDILEKVEKWLSACEEECWLEEYNRDDNRYNAGRGTHLILKRAERARVIVNKIPAMVETLTSKAEAWEESRGVEFLYDGVALLSMLEQYSALMKEKELERQRQRDQKKLQGQLIAQQETLYGSKPSPTKSVKNSRVSMGGVSSKRFSLGGAKLQTACAEKASVSSHRLKKGVTMQKQTAENHNLSSGKRGNSSGLSKHGDNSSNTNVTESPRIRKPLSPISSSLFSNTNPAKNQEQKKKNAELFEPNSGNKSPVAPLAENTYTVEGKSTPNKIAPIPMPTTPSTVSIAMLTAVTPSTPCVSRATEDIEYSFEERRAGFSLPKSHSRALSLA